MKNTNVLSNDIEKTKKVRQTADPPETEFFQKDLKPLQDKHSEKSHLNNKSIFYHIFQYFLVVLFHSAPSHSQKKLYSFDNAKNKIDI